MPKINEKDSVVASDKMSAINKDNPGFIGTQGQTLRPLQPVRSKGEQN